MEEHSELTRFILTANYNHRIIPPLQSRCQSFDLTPPVDMSIKRVLDILNMEKISIPAGEIDKIEQFVKTCHPDLRKCINEIQKNVIDGEIVLENLVKVKDAFVDSLYKIITTGLVIKARKKVIENEHVFNGDYTELLRSLFNYIHENNKIDNDVKAEQLIKVSEYIYRSAFVADPEINCYSCLLTLK